MTMRETMKTKVSGNMLLIGVVLGSISWLADAAMDSFLNHEGSLFDTLFFASVPELLMRSFVVLIIVGLSMYGWAVIARLKRAEKTLMASEQQYRSLIETAQDVIYTLSPEGMISSLNPAFEAITGWRHDEVIGKPFSAIIHPDDLPAGRELFHLVLQGKTPPRSQMRILTKAGRCLFGEFMVSPRLRNGKVVGILGIARDITERQNMEQALQVNEARYRDLFENANDLIQSVGADGKFLFVNRAWREVLGYSEEEVRSLTLFDVVHPDFRQHCMDIFNRVSHGEERDHIEAVFIAKNGRSVIVEGNINCSIVEGVPIATRGIFRDITEHRQASEFIQHILESVDEGFTVVDRDYRVISANKAYSDKVGLPLGDILNKHCYEVSHRLTKPCYEAGEDCAVRYTFDTGEPHTAIHVHSDRDGNPCYVETKSFPLKDSLGRIISAIEIHNDITEKKKLEDQLRHAQKMEAVGTLAGGIAHDFNNILTAIIGYGTLLQMKMQADGALRSYVDQILTSTERAASLTQSLLAFSRKQPMHFKAVELTALVARVQKLIARLIGEDIDIRIVQSSAALTIWADPGQIEQVLMNLATNARDAMAKGGLLTIETSLSELDSEFIRVNGYGKVGPYALLAVTDSGAGMDQKTLSRIFEPFFTTKEVGKGTGLGLSIVYGIVKQHGGYIQATSEPGRGTSFLLYLPLSIAPLEITQPIEHKYPQGGQATILIAEDDASVRNLTRAVLEGVGYTVIDAVDGEDALDKFEKHEGRVQLLLLDILMPKKNGVEVFETIKKKHPEVRVLFTSGYTADQMQAKGILQDRGHFISKPVAPRDLLKKVQEILEADQKKELHPVS
jgi:PAS domain S-box-containing protein